MAVLLPGEKTFDDTMTLRSNKERTTRTLDIGTRCHKLGFLRGRAKFGHK